MDSLVAVHNQKSNYIIDEYIIAYSNGCVGLRESDTWFVYHYAPLDTKVVLGYDLQVRILMERIFNIQISIQGFENKTYRKEAIKTGFKAIDERPINVCDCRALNEKE